VQTVSEIMKKLGIDQMSVAERLELMGDIWDSLDDSDPALDLSPEQKAELERRIAEDDANPDDGIPIEELEKLLPRPRGGK
jgi:putative addiction module component (TIGR02574 family)